MDPSVPISPRRQIAPDTRPVVEVIDDIMIPCLRAKTEAERLDMAAEMWRFARDMYVSLAKQQQPDWTPEEIQREAKRRLCAGLDYGVE